MQAQEIPEDKIVSELRSQGISPKDITDALNQAQIKSAISNSGEEMEEEIPQMSEEYDSQEGGDVYTPAPEQSYEEESYAPQQDYNYQASSGTDTSSVIEIAEQVFIEKNKKIESKLNEVMEFKTLAQSKIDSIDNRLKRIETMVDRLQIEILKEVGSYGKNLETIKKELNMIEDSFGEAVKNKKTSHKKK